MKYLEHLASLNECAFCHLVQPMITENEHAFMTCAIAPYAPDHLLVIPKRHVEHYLELTPDELRDLDAMEHRGYEILKALGHSDITSLFREGEHSGKSVPHLHRNLIPDVQIHDPGNLGPNRDMMTEAEVTEFVARINRLP